MKYQELQYVSEDQVTQLIESTGGNRVSKDDSRETEPNADYELFNSIIELKLIDEEGLNKQQRQNNIAKIFERTRHENANVCILDPELLSKKDRQKYFNLLGAPIKNCIKTGANQLETSRLKLNHSADRVLFIINNGYLALNHDEFLKVASKFARNDTSKIDYIVCAGMYYHSDGFESFVLAPIDIVPIQKVSNPNWYNNLSTGWGKLSESIMTNFVLTSQGDKQQKLPVLDIEFKINSITYLKPAPHLGQSSLFPKRPRINTTGINTCPPVAITFPKISKRSWELLKANTQDEWQLKDSFTEWNKIIVEQQEKEEDVKIFLPILVCDQKIIDLIDNAEYMFYKLLSDYANKIFHEKITKLYNSARRKEKLKTIIPAYIYVRTQEFGMDQKNDLSSLYIVKIEYGEERVTPIFEYKNIFLEHAVMIASAYALRCGFNMVLYDTDRKYSWS